MAVVIIVNPNMISSIPSQKYLIFMYKKSRWLLLCTQQSFCIMAFPFIWSWKAKKTMGNEILFHFFLSSRQLPPLILSSLFAYTIYKGSGKFRKCVFSYENVFSTENFDRNTLKRVFWIRYHNWYFTRTYFLSYSLLN